MRIIARKTLRDFVESLRGSHDQRVVKSALDAWFHEVQAAKWDTPADVIRSYANASIVGTDRVVFNIKGNSYRLVVAVDYRREAQTRRGLVRAVTRFKAVSRGRRG